MESLIRDYLEAVSRAVQLLKADGVSMPETDVDWATNALPPTGTLSDGTAYRKHGYGCEIELLDGKVDFDFGRTGETNGFDPWRLSLFAEARKTRYLGLDEQRITKAVQEALTTGEVIHPDGSRLYFLQSAA